MKPLPGDDMVEHKAFELAVRDSDYRKTRIEELRKKMRSSLRAVWSAVFIGAVVVMSSRRQPIGITHFFASVSIFGMILSGLYRAVRFRDEAKILQMLEIQEQIAASRTSAL